LRVLLLYICATSAQRVNTYIPIEESVTSVLRGLTDEFRRCWLARSRPGGLDDSVRQLTGSHEVV
jgi:hypothetical protein